MIEAKICSKEPFGDAIQMCCKGKWMSTATDVPYFQRTTHQNDQWGHPKKWHITKSPNQKTMQI